MIEIICVAERLTSAGLSRARESRVLAPDSESTLWPAELLNGEPVDCAESFGPQRQIVHSAADRAVERSVAVRTLLIARHLKDGVPIVGPQLREASPARDESAVAAARTAFVS